MQDLTEIELRMIEAIRNSPDPEETMRLLEEFIAQSEDE